MFAAPAEDVPWRGAWCNDHCESSRRMMLFEGEACAKGTALVADAREKKAWDPRPSSLACGGSSGGRARVTSSSARSGKSARNPRSGAELSPPDRVWMKTSEPSKRQRRNQPEMGPGAQSERAIVRRADAACDWKR